MTPCAVYNRLTESISLVLSRQYLLRAAETLSIAGNNEAALKALDAAEQLNAVMTADGHELEVRLRKTLLTLRAFDLVPNEILAEIMKLVLAQKEPYTKPFALTQVSRRWRDVALSTPALWRDTRAFLPPEDRTARRYRISPLQADCSGRASAHNISSRLVGTPSSAKVLEFCDRLSVHSMTRIEIGCQQLSASALAACIDLAMESRSTLIHFAIDLSKLECRQSSAQVSPLCLALLRIFTIAGNAPDLQDLQLTVPRDAVFDFEYVCGQLAKLPPFPPRRKQLRNFKWSGAGNADSGLYRIGSRSLPRRRGTGRLEDLLVGLTSNLRSGHLSLRPCCEWTELTFRALEQGALTLEDLTISYWTFFQWCFWRGGRQPVFPKLRRLVLCEDDCPETLPSISEECVPALIEVHGNLDQIASVLTPQIERATVYFDRCDVNLRLKPRASPEGILTLIEALANAENLKHLTVLFSLESSDGHVDLMQALSPSLCSRYRQRPSTDSSAILCPKLQHFALGVAGWAERTTMQHLLHSVHEASRDDGRDQWESLPCLSSALLVLQRERQSLSLGETVAEFKLRNNAKPSAFKSSPFSRGANHSNRGGDDEVKPTPRRSGMASEIKPGGLPLCEPLRSIRVRNFFVEEELWRAICRETVSEDGVESVSYTWTANSTDHTNEGIDSSGSRSRLRRLHFDVLPDPTIMMQLPRRPEPKRAGRKTHAWS